MPQRLLFFLFLAAVFRLGAQVPNVVIYTAGAGEWPCEPAVCMNPSNPAEILIGAVPDHCFTSGDGGLTWQHTILASPYGVNCDPVVLADDSGRFYYFHLVYDLSRVVCHRREGMQSPWTMESFTGLYNTYDVDKEWAAYDPVTGNLYTTWTRFNTWGSSNPQDSTDIFVARSADKGVTWGAQTLISNVGGNATGGFGSVHGSYVTTGPAGEVYVAWWSPAGLMFDRSTDQGVTWLGNDIKVTPSPIQWIVPLPGIMTGVSFPVIDCDRSNGPNRGNIYVSWTDKLSGSGDADVRIARSTDGGFTWSAPVRVNDDGPGKHQFFNQLTVDPVTGKVYVLFYDRRNYSDTRTDVYLAISSDGGQTFANYRISETPFIPYATVFFGHYIAICAYNDHVYASWMRMDDGQLSILGAPVDPVTVGQEPAPSAPVSLAQNAPNPFHESTFFSFKLEQSSVVTLTVTDFLGNKAVRIIDSEMLTAGKHVITFSPEQYDLPSGVYYYCLQTGKTMLTRKMICLRD